MWYHTVPSDLQELKVVNALLGAYADYYLLSESQSIDHIGAHLAPAAVGIEV